MTNNTTINYFEVDTKTNQFIRVFAPLIEIKDHSLRIKLNNEQFLIKSAYNLKSMLINNLLLGFCYKAEGEPYAKLYPLPINTNIFNSSHVREEFLPLSDEKRAELLSKSTEIQAMINESQQLKNEINHIVEDQIIESGELIEFAKGLPISKAQKIFLKGNSSLDDNATLEGLNSLSIQPLSEDRADDEKYQILEEKPSRTRQPITILSKKEKKELSKKKKKYFSSE